LLGENFNSYILPEDDMSNDELKIEGKQRLLIGNSQAIEHTEPYHKA